MKPPQAARLVNFYRVFNCLGQKKVLILFCLFFLLSVDYSYMLLLLLRSDMKVSFIQGSESVALSAITLIIRVSLPMLMDHIILSPSKRGSQRNHPHPSSHISLSPHKPNLRSPSPLPLHFHTFPLLSFYSYQRYSPRISARSSPVRTQQRSFPLLPIYGQD